MGVGGSGGIQVESRSGGGRRVVQLVLGGSMLALRRSPRVRLWWSGGDVEKEVIDVGDVVSWKTLEGRSGDVDSAVVDMRCCKFREA